MKLKRRYIILSLTAIVFGILFYCVDLTVAVETIRNAQPVYLVLAFLLMCSYPVWCAIRWNLIANQIGARLGFRQSFIIIMAAWPLGTITPAKSGDLIKVLFLKNILPYSKTTGVILAERMMDVVALCIYGASAGLIYGFYRASLFTGILLMGVLLFFVIAASPLVNWAPEKWRSLIQNVLEASMAIYRNLGTFFGILLITLVNWFCSILQTWCCYKAFQAEVPIFYIAAALPIAIFIGLIPVTLSGMGTRDSAMIFLFQKYAPYETNLAVGILYSIFGYWLLAIIGVPFMKAALGGSIKNIHGDSIRHELFSSERID
ncbi:MAG: flippase-like domain-containing protein [Candidatus Omnitrophica bacterium]|nr:flippase-like domain-containing protein [Candidatus Omnitrophota bacterium]